MLRAFGRAFGKATERQWFEGIQWYEDARREVREIAADFGLDVRTVAFVASALSNNKSWPQNVALTRSVLAEHRDGRTLSGHFSLCLDVVRRVLAGDFSALKGPKTLPFALALAGDDDAAVIDRHMWRAGGGRGSLTHKRHRLAQDALRRLARKVAIPVAAVQAIVWTVQRDGRTVA